MIRTKLGIVGLAIIVLGAIGAILPTSSVSAVAWNEDLLSAHEIDQPAGLGATCDSQQVAIGNPDSTEKAWVCVYQGNGWEYGTYSKWTRTGPQQWDGYNTYYFVIRFPGETAMYVVEGIPADGLFVHAPSSNHVLFAGPWVNEGRTLSIIKNVPSKIDKTVSNDNGLTTIKYQLKAGAIEQVLTDQNGQAVVLGNAVGSSNGRWLSLFISNAGMIRVNLTTFEKRWYSKYTVDHSNPYATGEVMMAVGNDGRYIARSGPGIPPYISDVGGVCGMSVTVFQTAWLNDPSSVDIHPCPERNLTPVVNQGMGADMLVAYIVGFSSNSEELITWAASYTYTDGVPTGTMNKWLSIHKSTYTPPLKLAYLALGDSYSSGEGDTQKDANGNKYYRPWTNNEENQAANQPREKCHISNRSYPYKLASGMDLAKDVPKQWDSVACSGATAWDVKTHASGNYKGQGKGSEKPWSTDGDKERLEGYDVAMLKTQALNEFIPGRQKQIEFMKQYQPQAITLTIGGNDVGFGEKIADCIKPSVTSCKTATEQGRKDLGIELQGQFKNLTELYRELHSASPTTKIYVLGYPQLIKGESNDLDCVGYSIGGLDGSERRVIAEATSYLNQVIDAATKYAGVKYLYVEDALNGHRICDGAFADHYMTGFTFGRGSDELPESFHPNAKGNQAVADKVKERLKENGTDHTLLTYPYSQQADTTIKAPAPSPYLASQTPIKKVVATKKVTQKSAQKQNPLQVFVDAYNFAADTVVGIFLHSDPVDLGEHIVNADGSLSTTVTIPGNVPAGYHTLVLTGTTPSGESVQYEQVIFVHGSNLNDIDEDGINDSADKCLFFTPANQDKDQDGIDDACDLEISDPPVPQDPYRVRAGNATRTYAGQSEQTTALYLERNIHAASNTGVSGDYDVDGDGWVVIATNQPSAPSTPPASTSPPLSPYARFWVEEITNTDGTKTKLPHISFRTSENGCVKYKPVDLSKITEANVGTRRVFVQEAIDTNTCRQEAPEADTDNNGQPDNTQPLYRARNGDPTVKHVRPNGTTFFEDVRQLYLERSTRAAETQLGKSDYAANDPLLTPTTILSTDTKDYRTNWSLIATTNNSPFNPAANFKKLHTANNQLYVITANTSNPFFTQCTAYKPQSLATIKRTTQTTRLMEMDFMQTLMMQNAC